MLLVLYGVVTLLFAVFHASFLYAAIPPLVMLSSLTFYSTSTRYLNYKPKRLRGRLLDPKEVRPEISFGVVFGLGVILIFLLGDGIQIGEDKSVYLPPNFPPFLYTIKLRNQQSSLPFRPVDDFREASLFLRTNLLRDNGGEEGGGGGEIIISRQDKEHQFVFTGIPLRLIDSQLGDNAVVMTKEGVERKEKEAISILSLTEEEAAKKLFSDYLDKKKDGDDVFVLVVYGGKVGFERDDLSAIGDGVGDDSLVHKVALNYYINILVLLSIASNIISRRQQSLSFFV